MSNQGGDCRVPDLDPLDLLRGRLEPSTWDTPACLDDATLAALADGALDAAARAAALPHLATCPRCRGAVASIARSLGDPAVAREVAALESPNRRRWLIGLPAAAAAVLVAIAVPRWLDDASGRHRGPPIPGAQAPVPLAPVGTVAEASGLRWGAVTGADRYRVILFDSSGRALYETQGADTAITLPDSVTLVPGRPYLWKVEARTGWNRWSSSELVQFSIASGADR
jgi:hypothetical protein